MTTPEIHNSVELIELIEHIGFLPLLYSGIRGFCAEDVVDENCRYVVLSDGGWDWPLWKWKGEIITEGGHVYGKFFGGKAGFISGSMGVTHVAATAHRKSPLSALWTSYIRFAPRPQRANLPKF